MNEPIQCFLIDDDKDDQEIFLMCLDEVGKNIDSKTADNGMEALTILDAGDGYLPDYIFLDVNMPKMNGIDCLKEIKKIERLKKVRIFMYSTTSGVSVLDEAKKLGAEDFIIKPTKTSELKAILSANFNPKGITV